MNENILKILWKVFRLSVRMHRGVLCPVSCPSFPFSCVLFLDGQELLIKKKRNFCASREETFAGAEKSLLFAFRLIVIFLPLALE